MPRYHRPETSPLTDFGEIETAHAWGVYEDPADLTPLQRQELGIHYASPSVRIGARENTHEELQGIGGSTEIVDATNDEYYRRKIASGLIKKDF